MVTGFSSLYIYQRMYFQFNIAYEECKWWEFRKKRSIKEEINWIYPLMKNEYKFMNN